jgi:outer membrane lipoprotein-sorting protein
MKCLSQEQLARLALGLSEDADLAAHLAECAACRAGLETMQTLARQLTEAHAQLSEGHEAARARLLAMLPAASEVGQAFQPDPESAGDRRGVKLRVRLESLTYSRRITHWIGGLTMRQRIALGSVGVAAVLGLLLLWGGSVTQPVSAMEKMAENIRKARSYTASLYMELQIPQQPGKPLDKGEMTGKVYWLAPRSYRVDFKTTPFPAVHGGPHPGLQDMTQISPTGKPGIFIERTSKTFWRLPAERGQVLGFEMMEKLGEFSGQADRHLDDKVIHGRKAHGFEIESTKIDPDAPLGLFVIWVDAESNLPILLRWHVNAQVPQIVRMENFQWNIDLDLKLFDTTPPEGYTDATPTVTEPSLEEQVRRITEGLRLYAELTGGRYPHVKKVEARVAREELFKMYGIEVRPGRVSEELVRNEKFRKILRCFLGLSHISHTQMSNPDAAYYGKTVGPSDKDKVLLRWKLDDGKYEVIFGDLRSETVTAERLHALEGK